MPTKQSSGDQGTTDKLKKVIKITAIKQLAQRRIDKREQITVVTGPVVKRGVGSGAQADSREPRFKVFDVKFGDLKKAIRISGSESLIPLQLSLLQGVHSLLSEKLSGDISKESFEQWIQEFESSFKSKGGGKEAFLTWQAKFTPWGSPQEQRPKIWVLGTEAEQKEEVIHTVQLFPDRSVEAEFKIFSGTYRDLINQIMLFWALKDMGGGGQEPSSKPGRFITGHPLVILRFKEVLDTTSKSRPLFFEKSFRLIDKTDNPDSGKFSLISKTDVESLAKRIVATFKDKFFWEYGHKCLSYKGPKPRSQGLDGWAYCKTQSDGIALFQKIALCAQVEIDTKLFRISEAVDEGAFPQTPKEYTLLGKKEIAPIHRKKCQASFYDAKIYLPFSQQTIPLCKGQILLV
jgi:hypothetical protein